MKFFKNIEISKAFGVSPTTVANWIVASKLGKNKIQLVEVDGKDYILDTLTNHLIIQKLVNKGKKFKARDAFQTIIPSKDFYNIFGSEQISDIVNNLNLYQEIPNKYNYWDRGAGYWEAFVKNCLKEKVRNIVNDTPEMLSKAFDFIVNETTKDEKINIIDIGVGTGHHIKDFVARLKAVRYIKKYVGIEMSVPLINLAKQNFKVWFGEDLKIEFHNLDFTRHDIQELLFYNAHPVDSQNELTSRNIVFLLGGTLQNQREYMDALFNLKNSLGENDILVLGHTLDTPEAKLDFELSTQSDTKEYEKIPDIERWIPDLLGIRQDLYEVETYFDADVKCRFMKLVLNQDIEINFATEKFKKKIFLAKGSKVTTWRHVHHSSSEIIHILNKLDLFTKLFIVSNDNMHALTVSIRKYYNF